LIRDFWDEKEDNIFICDFNKCETNGGLYFLDKLAIEPNNLHPDWHFSTRIAHLFAQFINDMQKEFLNRDSKQV
jgi:hypothetical protein